MKEPTIIYVVTHGDYSAYDIDGMFSTREKAEEWIEHTYDPSYYHIEEHELDGVEPDRSDKLFKVLIDYEDFNARVTDRLYVDCRQSDEKINTVRMTDSLDMEMYIVTDHPKRALKIASERLAQVKAEDWKYPLLHTKCGFADEELVEVMERGLRGHVFFPFVESHYPVYRFGTGELVIPKGIKMVHYTLVEIKEEKE